MDTLSVAIITYNEEKHISKCLDSITAVADEIIIVDSYSNDSTMDICNKYPTKIIQNKFSARLTYNLGPKWSFLVEPMYSRTYYSENVLNINNSSKFGMGVGLIFNL